jgi:hypothetical protein
MLSALICINTNLIDKICMWNQSEVNKRGQYKYLVWLESDRIKASLAVLSTSTKQRVKGAWQKEVWHKQEDGWQVLLMKSLKALGRSGTERR